MSAPQVDIVANLRALADTLESARRFGVPLPFSATATDYDTPQIHVHDAEAWHAWADYLDLKAARMIATDRDHLWLDAAAAECPHLTVVAIVEQATGAEHVAAAVRRNPLPPSTKPLDEKIEEGAARHAARAAELGTVTTDS